MTVFAVVSHPSIRALTTGYILGSIGMGVPLLLIVNRKKRWVTRAHRLARESGIDLPSRLEDRVARRLRNEWLSSLVFFPLIMVPSLFISSTSALRDATFWATWFPRLAMLLSIFGVIISFSTVIVARWSIPGPTRLSHFPKVRLREAFTPAETYTLVAGIGATGAVVAGGLSQVHSPISWWLFEFGAFALAGVLWWLMELAVLHHPSTASDAKELQWDDVFRFRRVRSLAIGAAWTPPMFGFYLDLMTNQQLSHFQHGVLWPMYVPIVVLAGVIMIFRQGRQLWRLV
jgi:hypothetical protein